MIWLEIFLAVVAGVRLSRVFGAGADFGVYFSAIGLWLQGLNPYAIGVGYIYPPSFLALFSWLSFFSNQRAGEIFFWGSFIILAMIFYCCREMLGKWCLPLFLLLLNWFPVLNTLGMGQVNLWVLGCCLLCLYETKKEHLVRAGVWLGIAAGMKVLPLLFWPYLWLTGKKRVVIVASLLFLALNFWPDYFLILKSIGGVESPYYFNQSLPAMFSRMGVSTLGWMVVDILIYVLALKKAVTARFGFFGFSLMLVTMVLVSPTAWFHYFVFFIPAIIFLVGYKQWGRGWWVGGLLLLGFVLKDPSLLQKSDLLYNHGAIGGIMIWVAMMMGRKSHGASSHT